MLLPLPLLDLVPLPAKPPRFPGTVWGVESPEQSVGSQKSRIPAQVGSPTAYEHLRLTQRKCSSQGLFSQPDSSSVRKCSSLARLSVHPQVFLPINLWFSSMKCQLGQEGGSWGRTSTDHANWSATQIQGFAFKQIPIEVWCWRHP